MAAKDRVNPGSQTSLREANRARIIDAVQQRGSITQVELAGVTGLSAATISNIVKELTQAGVLSTAFTSRSGRRAHEVTLARISGVVAGLHFAERSLRAALADVTQRVLAEQRLPLPHEHRADIGLDTAALLLEEMLDAVGAERSELLAVGVGLPAPVDVVAGTVAASGVLRAWDGAQVATALEDRLGVPVVVDNDANLGAIAEVRLGVARELTDVVYVRASHGVGMGVVVGSRILHGRSGLAGELGHVVVDRDGRRCRCGNRGCLETVVGADALLAALQPRHGHLALRDVVARAEAGDADLRAALADVGAALGRALGTVCTLLDPQAVVIGGDMAHAGEVLLGPLRAALHADALTGAAGPVEVRAGTLGDQAEVRGAVAVALDRSGVVAARAVVL